MELLCHVPSPSKTPKDANAYSPALCTVQALLLP